MVCIVLLFSLWPVMGLASEAGAGSVPVKLEISVNPATMAGPSTVKVSVKVTNIGDEDLPGNVSLYDPASKTVTDFGDGGSTPLAIGTSYSCETSWDVTATNLENGKITYSLKYPAYNEAGELVRKTISASAEVKKATPVPGVSIKRIISTPMATKGQEVMVTYDIQNTGDVTLKDIKIKEHKNISSKVQTIATLEPGALGRAEFPVTMGTKDLTTEATITYKLDGASKTYTEKVEATKIVYGTPSLTAKLETSAKSAKIDETVTLKLTLENTGNVDYDNIRVTDPILGEVFVNQQVPSKQKLELEKEIAVLASASYTFSVEATDSAGNTMTLATSKVDVAAIDPSKTLNLSVSATANREVIYEQPGLVTFKIEVANTGEIDAADVKVSCGDQAMYTFDTIAAGQTRSFTRDVSATMAGKFQFTATTKDQLNNTVSFLSNEIQIGYTKPTPEPTTAPTLPAPTLNLIAIPNKVDIPPALTTIQSVAQTLAVVLAVLFGIAFLLLIVATVRRIVAKKASEKAYDHLERALRRDYSQEPEEREAEKTDGEPDAGDADPVEMDINGDALNDDLFSVDLPDEETLPDEGAEDALPDVAEEDEDLAALPEDEQPKTDAAPDPNAPTTAYDFAHRRRSRRSDNKGKGIQA